jgi:hypothetical protein
VKRRIGRVMGSKNASILAWLLNIKYKELRNTGISKKGRHDFALSGVDIVLQDVYLCSHCVKE